MRHTKLFLLLAFTLITYAGFAQMYNPVTWSIEQKSTGKNTADIVVRAKIDKGWHLYGLNIPAGGPVATTIVVEQLDNAKKEGGIQSK